MRGIELIVKNDVFILIRHRYERHFYIAYIDLACLKLYSDTYIFSSFCPHCNCRLPGFQSFCDRVGSGISGRRIDRHIINFNLYICICQRIDPV